MKVSSRLLSVVAIAAGLLVVSAAVALAGWQAQSSYYGVYQGVNSEPISIIVSERGEGSPAVYGPEETRVKEAFGGHWYDNYGCFNPLVKFHGDLVTLSLSTDNGTTFDYGPFVGCGDGERNHLRAWRKVDQLESQGGLPFDYRRTVYIAPSLETLYGHTVYDNNNQSVGICPTGAPLEPHCLTRKAFVWGRDGYFSQPNDRSAWWDIQYGWTNKHGWPQYGYWVNLSPPPTAFIFQGLAWFAGDGWAGIIEDSWDRATAANAIYSSSSKNSFASGPEKAFDGTQDGNDFNAASRWLSNYSVGPPHWLQVELPNQDGEGHVKWYDSVQVVSGVWISGAYSQTLESFTIQVSEDGNAWIPVATANDLPDGNGVVVLNFSPRTEPFVRLLVSETHAGDRAMVYTFKVFRRP